MVPGSTLMYGSSFCIVTLTPRLFRTRPIAAAVTPFPTLLTTPPVQKMYLGMASPPRLQRDQRLELAVRSGARTGPNLQSLITNLCTKKGGGEGHFEGDPPHRIESLPVQVATPCGHRAPLDQLSQVLGGSLHVQENQTEFGPGASQNRQHGVLADRHENHVAVVAVDVDLVEDATTQLAGDALAERQHGGRHRGDAVFLDPGRE